MKQSIARLLGRGPRRESVVQALLIVFSVLLAFYVDDYRERLEARARQHQALDMIMAELASNRSSVSSKIEYHRELLQQLRKKREDGAYLQASLFEVLVHSAPRGINPPQVHATAWQTAMTDAALQRLDYAQYHRLASAYRMQSTGIEATWSRIVSVLDKDAFAKPASAASLDYVAFLVSEAIAQEEYLVREYDKVLSEDAAPTDGSCR